MFDIIFFSTRSGDRILTSRDQVSGELKRYLETKFQATTVCAHVQIKLAMYQELNEIEMLEFVLSYSLPPVGEM